MAAKLAAIKKWEFQNFTNKSHKESYNTSYETVRKGFVLYKVNVTQKSHFHGQIWLKNEKRKNHSQSKRIY